MAKMLDSAAPINIATTSERAMLTQTTTKRRDGTGPWYGRPGQRFRERAMPQIRACYRPIMRKSFFLLALCVATSLLAQTQTPPVDDKNNRANLTIAVEALG